MIYILHGNNLNKRAKELNNTKSLYEKSHEHHQLDLSTDNLDSLKELVFQTGLFATKKYITLRQLLTLKISPEELNEILRYANQNNHILVIIEDKLTKTIKDKIKIEANYIDCEQEKNQSNFNLFSLTEALGERNKKKLWILYYAAIAKKTDPEEIWNILWWQLKTLNQISANNGQNPNLKPFVYNKSKRYLSNYQKDIKKVTLSFLKSQANARQGSDLKDELELFILNTL